MSRVTWNIGGAEIVVSSHGYIVLPYGHVSIASLGFNEFGNDRADAPMYGGMWDMDMTWPEWDIDPRLRRAVTHYIEAVRLERPFGDQRT